ncbi:uncharacterized protein LOC127838828 isoform X2 [Dreissena polymorpha]|uniref:uncharacterized protein LOC127838828 isoform X2 n=1 Tax=Dreissena polymorpha TaxID=45954 RepID=UPI00226440AA|nr:uncharacterized protein LOC127838828 isoform X2 [Dreissena polymorpha]
MQRVYKRYPLYTYITQFHRCLNDKLYFNISLNMEHGSLIGLFLDVSGSMKENAVGSVEKEGEWVRSLFQVIDDVIKHDVNENNRVFTIGFGGQSNDGTFDILKSIDKAQHQKERLEQGRENAGRGTVKDIFKVLIRHGAHYLEHWTTVEQVQRHISQAEAEMFLEAIQNDDSLATRIVKECLPDACRGMSQTTPIGGVLSLIPGFDFLTTNAVTAFRTATPAEIRKAIQSGIGLIKNNFKLTPINVTKAAESVQKAATTIRGTVHGAELTDRRRQELLNLVKPVIYGGTPIVSALRSASEIFTKESSNVEKIMIVISDGEWSDSPSFLDLLKDVKIVCCFVSRSSNIRPRHLFDTAEFYWDPGAEKMF